MTCHRLPSAIVCTSSGPTVDLSPYGSIVRMDFDKRFGPRFEMKNGREIANPSRRTWSAFEAWYAEYKKEITAASGGDTP